MEKVIINDNRGTSEFNVSAVLAGQRVLYIEGEINMELAMNFQRQVQYLTIQDRNAPIKVFVNSPGGMIAAGLIIYDIIQSSTAPIELYCTGAAYSMGAIIFCCGKHGRYILPHSKVMIHEPLVAGGVGGKTSSIQTLANDLLATKEKMDKILSEHTGKPLEEISQATNKDNYFTAEEAIEFGLCDRIMGFGEMMEGIE